MRLDGTARICAPLRRVLDAGSIRDGGIAGTPGSDGLSGVMPGGWPATALRQLGRQEYIGGDGECRKESIQDCDSPRSMNFCWTHLLVGRERGNPTAFADLSPDTFTSLPMPMTLVLLCIL